MSVRSIICLVIAAHGGCVDPDDSLGSDEQATHGHHGHGAPRIDSLADAADHADRRVGTAVAYGPLTTEAPYRSVLRDEFDYVTPENELKWGALQPTDRNHWSFAQADTIVESADDHHQDVKGHALVWHNQLPPFVSDALTPKQLERYLEKHIDRTVKRYRHDIRAWDVVNEAVADDGTLRDTVFLRKLGAGYIARAFRDAHDADHDAKLYYNDYGIDTINTKSNAVLALVTQLKAAHVPIHGVGFQMHLEAHNAPSTAAIVANFERFAQLGLSVNISELDVRVAGVAGDLATKLAVQKQVYHRVVAACMQVPRCVSITTWGFTDKHSWIDSTFGPDDPLPFDELYRRKPAYYAMIDGFLEVPADEQGAAPNLIANATFEVGTDGWITWGGTLATSTHGAHTGLRGAVVRDRTATFHGPVYDVRALVTAGRGYDVSAWARIDTASDAVRLSAKTRCAGGADTFTTIAAGTATNTGWVRLAGELAVPSCTLDEIVIYVEGPAAGVALYADDAAIRPQPGGLGPNLIANPGFEAGTAGWFGFGGPTITATAAQAHSGAQSGQASNRTASFQGPASNLLGLAVPGNVYVASSWVRVDGAPTATTNLTLKIRCGTTDSFTQIATGTALATGWTLLSGTFTVPACSPTEVTFYVEGPPAGVNILIDDVSVRQDISTLGPNVITNGTFESGTAGWFPFGPATVAASAAQAQSGAQSGLVSNRTGTWQGIATNILSAVTTGNYQANAWVRIGGAAASEVYLTLKSRCAGGADTFVRVATGNATSTGWVQMDGTLAVPACPLEEVTMYFEGPAVGVDIYIDDVTLRREP